MTLYRQVVEELGLKQLDVYRVSGDKGGFKDVLRLFDPASGRVFTVDLGRVRESVDPLEFLEAVVNAAREKGVTLPDRRVAELRSALSKRSPRGSQ